MCQVNVVPSVTSSLYFRRENPSDHSFNVTVIIFNAHTKVSMSKLKQSSDPILPGESVASIEEFEGGKNTYIDNGLIRSAAVGHKVLDFKRRTVRIEQKNPPILPKVGDILVGYVEMLFSSMMSIRVTLYKRHKINIWFFRHFIS